MTCANTRGMIASCTLRNYAVNIGAFPYIYPYTVSERVVAGFYEKLRRGAPPFRLVLFAVPSTNSFTLARSAPQKVRTIPGGAVVFFLARCSLCAPSLRSSLAVLSHPLSRSVYVFLQH